MVSFNRPTGSCLSQVSLYVRCGTWVNVFSMNSLYTYKHVKRSRTSACMCTSLPAVLRSLGCVLGGGPGCGGRGGTGPSVSGRGMQGMKLWKYMCYSIISLSY